MLRALGSRGGIGAGEKWNPTCNFPSVCARKGDVHEKGIVGGREEAVEAALGGASWVELEGLVGVWHWGPSLEWEGA